MRGHETTPGYVRIPGRGAALGAATLAVAALAATATHGSPRDEGDGSRWARRLPGGARVELVGVGDPDAQPPAWWTPDGEPLAGPVADVPGGSRGAGERSRAFAVRVTGPGAVERSVRWDFGPDLGSSAFRGVLRGQPLAGVECVVVALPVDEARREIRLSVATVPWVTMASRPRPAGPDEPGQDRVAFTEPRAVDGGTTLVVVEDLVDLDTRVVAVDRAGRVRHASQGDIGRTAGFRSHDLLFRGLAPGELDHFELQARPAESVAFEGVALDPRRP